MMDLDELQSVQSRERQTDSLQQLRDSFYQEAGEFIQQLRDERERAAERADDPWNSPEVGRLSDDIETADQTVEAIYERRVGKIVKMASLAAADMPTEDQGLTTEERQLFDGLVEAIEGNRAQVMAVLDGEDAPDPTGSAAAEPEDPTAEQSAADRASPPGTDAGPADTGSTDAGLADADGTVDKGSGHPDNGEESEAPPPEGVDAADLMGDGAASEDGTAPQDSAADDPSPDPSPPPDPAAEEQAASSASGSTPDAPPAGELDADESAYDGGPSTGDGGDDPSPSVDRATVRITGDVGEILGVDQRAYDLSSEDVVTLPERNADPLVENGVAERLD